MVLPACCYSCFYDFEFRLVRNRSRELVELLSDVEKIRAERRKAKANKSKYIGVGNDDMSFESGGGGGRYGGYGNDSFGGGGSGSYTGNYSNGIVFLKPFSMSTPNQKE